MMAVHNEKIATVSFLGALCVVLIHIEVKAAEGTTSWWIYQLSANGFCRWAVPFFFATSGYFLAAHVDEDGWWMRAVKKRFRTLLIPYFIWNVVMAAYVLCLILGANMIAHRELTANMLKGWDVLMYFGLHPQGGQYGALWFIRSLYLYVLISPVLVAVIRRAGWLVPMVLLGLSSAGLPHNYYLGWLMYFTAGIAARFRSIAICKHFGWGVIPGMIWIYLHKAYMLEAEMIGQWDSTPLPAVVMVVVGVWAITPYSLQIPAFCVRSTFAIYLLHFFFIRAFVCSLPPLQTTWCQIIEWIVVVFLSIISYNIVLRHMPKVANVIFGGR